MTELLHLENYSFTYPQQRRPALSHVTLTVPEGAFMVLCGPSGCGDRLRAAVTGESGGDGQGLA